MECYKCDRKPVESGRNFYPVDPAGAKGRRWVCHICMTPEEKDGVPKDVYDLVAIIKKAGKK
jgi:hypothetical protein